MRSISIALAMSALLVTGACSKDAADTSSSTTSPAASSNAAGESLTPEQLGELGAAIKKNPTDAQRLLSERGLTEDTFEKAIRKVSEDPAASQKYAEAYKRASA